MFTLSDLASLITATYIVLFLIVAGLVAWLVRSWLWKLIGVIVVAVAFAVPLVNSHIEETKRIAHNRMIADRFTQLCKEKAGEKIMKTIDGVDGFLIMRPRQPTKDHREYLDQFWMGDPYGHSDLEAEKPEQVFLTDRRGYEGTGISISPIRGYDFIELPASEHKPDGATKYLKISVSNRQIDSDGREHLEYQRTWSNTVQSRYGLYWEDISTVEDRKYWIAGGRMRIIELSTNLVLGERTGYVIDREQGARIGQGIPWLLAQRNACPPFQSDSTKSKEFVAKILRPLRENNRGQ
jgi:hypothetical protein